MMKTHLLLVAGIFSTSLGCYMAWRTLRTAPTAIDRRSFNAGAVSAGCVMLERGYLLVPTRIGDFTNSGWLTDLAWQEFQDELRTNHP
jgi:hypothetical protein